jgi:hypothetical protein
MYVYIYKYTNIYIYIHTYTARAWTAKANNNNVIYNCGDNSNSSDEKYQAQNDDQGLIDKNVAEIHMHCKKRQHDAMSKRLFVYFIFVVRIFRYVIIYHLYL